MTFMLNREAKQLKGDRCQAPVSPMYPIAIMRNQPKGVRTGSDLINPKYYFCKDGRIFCIYKFYNKLYCHRLN